VAQRRISSSSTPPACAPLARTLICAARAVDEAAAAVQSLFTLLKGLREPGITSVFVRGREIVAGQVR
jgi:hypothetical protein